MIKIAHRGNTKGPLKEYENNPLYIREALEADYDVEIDVWLLEGDLFLGHDIAEYKVNFEFLENKNLWCHCKNVDALFFLLNNNIRCFFHENDEATLTSDGYIWTYPGSKLTNKSICVMPEKNGWDIPSCVFGVCSDYVGNIEEYIK
tara:strand:+ start:3772 stop:4212 length:441 start_codon:yes stop_codon:yes gene_type:complete